jgi:glucose-6-phosphate 1-dehydrogenase
MSTILPRSDALVFFGATGDLALKMIFPALQALVKDGRLDVPVIGIAKAGWDVARLRERARESIEKYGDGVTGAGGVTGAAFEKLCSLLRYVDGDYGDPKTFDRLRDTLGGAKCPLFYLAIPPATFGPVVNGLGRSGCHAGARVVVEKPFGRDLASARELNRTLLNVFPEEAIFRIDHFLGKEAVRSLLYFRFANTFLEPSWNHSYVDRIEITMAESFGIQGRGRMYDDTGAIRDVLENHLLQVVASLAMDSPDRTALEAHRDARTDALRSVVPVAPRDLVRGQFDGYANEPGVAAGSQVETYAALRLQLDSPRWKGVPFFIRTGKCLPVTCTEVLVKFKALAHRAFDDSPSDAGTSYVRFRLDPQTAVALGVREKAPGEAMVGRDTELLAPAMPSNEMTSYKYLLGDAMVGDATLFAREDSVEAEWRAVDGVLGNTTPIYSYAPGTWGPKEADRVGPAEGWHVPVLDSLDPRTQRAA